MTGRAEHGAGRATHQVVEDDVVHLHRQLALRIVVADLQGAAGQLHFGGKRKGKVGGGGGGGGSSMKYASIAFWVFFLTLQAYKV